MAKKKKATRKKSSKKVNKTAAVKDYLADHPDAGPSEIAAAMKKKGIDLTPGYASRIKSTAKSAPAKRKSAAKKKASADTTPVEDVKQAGQLLYHAVDLVMKAGAKEAKTLVEMASKMVERISEKKK